MMKCAYCGNEDPNTLWDEFIVQNALIELIQKQV